MADLPPTVVARLLRDALVQGKRPYLTVTSDSMAPLICHGDQVQLAPASLEKLRSGDIVVVCGARALVTHRYWGCRSNNNQKRLITRGDRPWHFDPPYPAEDLVAQVVGRRRDTYWLSFTHGPGRWLNRHLAQLAALEIRLNGQALESPSRSITTFRQDSSAQADASLDQLFVRLARRLLYSWAIMLTSGVGLVSRLENRN
jgi:signal peptidase I